MWEGGGGRAQVARRSLVCQFKEDVQEKADTDEASSLRHDLISGLGLLFTSINSDSNLQILALCTSRYPFS